MKAISIIVLFFMAVYPRLLVANQFAAQKCVVGMSAPWACHKVATGESWEQLFPESTYREKVQKYNRQNRTLRAGQWLVLPPQELAWEKLSPLPSTLENTPRQSVIVFDPAQLAWGFYQNGKQIRWGPAVGGKAFCPDVGRPCLTSSGIFDITETASEERRSNLFPRGCRQTACAPMPYFLRFTTKGMGMHARSMRGAHTTHGCVGLFAQDANYLNDQVRALIGKTDYGYLNGAELQQSREQIALIVLPY